MAVKHPDIKWHANSSQCSVCHVFVILYSIKGLIQWPTAYHSQRSADGMTAGVSVWGCLLQDLNGNTSKSVHIQNFQFVGTYQCSKHNFLVSSHQLPAAYTHRSDRCQSAVKPHTRKRGLFFMFCKKIQRKIYQNHNMHLCNYPLSN